jgi:hypothetical protein
MKITKNKIVAEGKLSYHVDEGEADTYVVGVELEMSLAEFDKLSELALSEMNKGVELSQQEVELLKAIVESFSGSFDNAPECLGELYNKDPKGVWKQFWALHKKIQAL